MTENVRLNPSVVRALNPPENKDYVLVRDSLLQGFGVRVTASGFKSFFVEKRVTVPGKKSRVRRVTLGKFPDMTVDRARELALKQLSDMAEGIDPVEAHAAHIFSEKTLGNAFDEYIDFRQASRKPLKERTLEGYAYARNKYLADWIKKPLADVTRNMVKKRHAELTQRSPAQADQAFKYLSAVYTWAIDEYVDNRDRPLLTVNPVRILTHDDLWNKVKAKQTIIKQTDLAAWYQGVESLRAQRLGYGPMMADYFLLLLFTCLRKSEGAMIQWADVDFDSRAFAVRDTKNSLDHVLPMSDFVESLFKRRREACSTKENLVFPVRGSKHGHIKNPYKSRNAIVAHSGVSFAPHDLRRSGATYLSLMGYSEDLVGKTLNHKVPRSNVTAGYINWDEIKLQKLRKPIQDLADFLQREMGIGEPGKVVRFPG
ncbi:MAG: integrase family protein [Pseudomonadota bacterium]